MIPTRYQTAIYNWIEDGDGNAVVEAVAGSGKTSTLIEALKHIREPVSVREDGGWDSCFGERPQARALFVAFNKHIADELRRRVPKFVQASTLNSVGWGVCRASVRCELDQYKDDNILRTLVERNVYPKIRRPATRIVGLAKSLLIMSGVELDARFDDILSDYDITVPTVQGLDFKATVLTLWGKSVSQTSMLNFDDQKFQPIFQDWSVPMFPFVFADEVQDFSPCDIEFVRRLSKGGRAVLVGDKNQAIYQFRGSTQDAIPTMIAAFDATVLPLSICWRCPDAVIAEARKIVPRIEAPVPNAKGAGLVATISTPEFLAAVRDGDYVLCRTTAPLVKRCLALIGKGRKAKVKGRDIGQGLLAFLEGLASSPHTPIIEFLDRLWSHKSDRVGKLAALGRDAEVQAVEDKCETLEVLAMDCTITADIEVKINQVFSDDDSPGVTFCTIHRSKGLEAPRIFLLRPDLLPHPRAVSAAARAQEANLHYVAVTRSQSEFFYVRKETHEK